MTEMFNYLVKTLSRTKRKDYENYVVNRIWSRLNDTEIKPVTQQYCRRKDGQYALLDMYFPQLGVAIECDEPFHNSPESTANDQERSKEIINTTQRDLIGAISENGINIQRVTISEGLTEVNLQIERIILTLKARKQELLEAGRFTPWDPTISDAERARISGEIKVDDDYLFRTNADVAKVCGTSMGPRRSTTWIEHAEPGHRTLLWCAPLAILDNGKFSGGRLDTGWTNFLSSDGTHLYESNKNWPPPEHTQEGDTWQYSGEEPSFDDFARVVFGKSRNALGIHGNRFLGIFHDTGQRQLLGGKVFKEYQQISTNLPLPQG